MHKTVTLSKNTHIRCDIDLYLNFTPYAIVSKCAEEKSHQNLWPMGRLAKS